MPGAAFVELALRAAEQVGAESIEELTLQVPLLLAEQGATQLQVSVSGPDEEGKRGITIHSRPEGEETEWTQNASGTLSQEAAPDPELPESWPPEGAEPIDVDYLYDVLAEHGLEYGPTFQGLSAAWRQGDEIYAEASLPEEQVQAAEAFGIHPALLESALHGVALGEDGSGEIELPSSWSGVSLAAVGASGLRVKIAPSEDGGLSLLLADAAGAPLGTIANLTRSPLDLSQLKGAKQTQEGVLELGWSEVTLKEVDAAPEGIETWRWDHEADSLPDAEAAREAAKAALKTIQQWLTDESKADSRLILLTQGAMAARGGDSPDPAQAAIWGLVRSAQTEHPGRFSLIDIDGTEASEAVLASALALAEEPQLALREGQALAPRILRAKADAEESATERFGPNHTVLVTGATGGLGALVAQHLATHHGARHLLLVSRSGPEAEGADELKTELEGLGAKTKIAACDVSDSEALKKVLDAIPSEHPLGAVIHCAGALADATVETLTEEQIDQVFTPKAQGAWNLHELTKESDLSAFILFSSAAGTLGGPGQGNYAAANVFLDALAQKRAAEGKPATSIAWGLWQQESGMVSSLSEANLARMQRGGIGVLSNQQGLTLFDTAIGADRPQTIALPIETAALRGLASVGALPPILSGLVRTPKRRSAASGSLAKQLANLPDAEHEGFVLELVRSQVAAVLGHPSGQEIEPGKPFQELGFDSLAAVELRNQLGAIAGLRLPAPVVFDHPNSNALASYLLMATVADDGGRAASESKEAEIREALTSIPLARLRSSGLIDPLLRLAEPSDEAEVDDSDLIDSMGVEDLIRLSSEDLPAESEEEDLS